MTYCGNIITMLKKRLKVGVDKDLAVSHVAGMTLSLLLTTVLQSEQQHDHDLAKGQRMLPLHAAAH